MTTINIIYQFFDFFAIILFMEGIKYCICLITTDSKDTATQIANRLVEEKLAACVNIIPEINSIYRWKGEIERSPELLLIVKTKIALIKDVIKFVKSIHNYTVPEIIFLPIIDGYEGYLSWLEENTLSTIDTSKNKEDQR